MAIAFSVVFAFVSFAQKQDPKLKFFDSQRGSIEMRKYYGENPFEKGFSWDAYLSEGIQMARYGPHELWGMGRFQTVVAHSYDKKIRVSGEVYMIDGTYRYILNSEWTGSFSLSHSSTHITQDILNPFYADIPELPEGLLSDVNVLSLAISRNSVWGDSLPIKIEVAYQPLDVMIPDVGENSRYVRPYYFKIESALWRLSPSWQMSLMTETEFGGGRKSIGKIEARLEMMTPKQKEGRFQLFFQRFFYESDIGSNPRFGFFPAEFALGWRCVFN